MCRSMIRDFVPAARIASSSAGNLADAFADDKEGRFRFKAPQELEHARRVGRVRSIVDREPDFAPGRFEMSAAPAPTTDNSPPASGRG